MTNDPNNPAVTGDAAEKQAPLQQPGDAAAPSDRQENDFAGSDANEQDPDESLTPAEARELRDRAAKADENWDKYLRLNADFDNFKKRAARERSEAIRYANEALIEKLLPIVDNFEAALNAMNDPGANLDSVRTGVKMIYTQIKGFLNEHGAEEIDAMGQAFDPNLHEAVSQEPTADVPEGQVVQQMRKGYKLRDRLIRPSMVVVARKP